ncbi:MAG: acetyl-CoA carboxylase biotin carboxyl carrier protein subunit [Sediminibacterium sp.]|nr:acetyl-CoA carboxylase biotin carboxyl carrier protein subunit [Sediminibacterium sp.]
MYTVTFNGHSIKADLKIDNGLLTGVLDDKAIQGDWIKINERQYHLLYNRQSYKVDLIKLDEAEKSITLRINGHKQTVKLQDRYDALLKQLGMDNLTSKKVNDLKAPMPGKVLSIAVSEGQDVKKGDALIVLEAMKMENVLKSPCDGIIRKIPVSAQQVVEKNQLLIQF